MNIAFNAAMNAIFTPLACQVLGRDFGIIPSYAYHQNGSAFIKNHWGSFPTSMLPYWKASNCNNQLCQVWQTQFNVSISNGKIDDSKLPNKIKKAWDQLNCPSMFAFYNSDDMNCQVLDTKYGFAVSEYNRRGQVQNFMPTKALQFWRDKNCNDQMCRIWKTQFNVTANDVNSANLPLPASINEVWDQRNCQEKLFVKNCTRGPCDNGFCSQLVSCTYV